MSVNTKMAWRNIWRNPRRSVLTISAIAFAGLLLVFMLSFQLGTYDDMIDFSLRVHTGHLQVAAKGYPENREMRTVIQHPRAVGRILEGIDGVYNYTFRSNAFCVLSSDKRTYGAMVTGIVPEKEAAVTTVDDVIQTGDYLSSPSANDILLGKTLAHNLKAKINDEIVLLGQGRDGSVAAGALTVKGIFATGNTEMDWNVAMMALDTFDELFFMRDSVHEIVIVCNRLDNVAAVERKLKAAIAKENFDNSLIVRNWQELLPGLLQGIKIDLFSGIIFYLLLIIVVAFSIFNTFLMAVFERTKEFGVLLALGVTPQRLTKLLLYESMMITFMGIAAGMAGGAALTLYFAHQGIRIPGMEQMLSQYGLPQVLRPELSWLSLFLGPAVVVCVTFLTALYPAFRVRFLKPADALRTVK